MSKRSKVTLIPTESDLRMHHLNAPGFFFFPVSFFFFFFFQHSLWFDGPRFELFPNRIGPDQTSHTTAPDLGLVIFLFLARLYEVQGELL